MRPSLARWRRRVRRPRGYDQVVVRPARRLLHASLPRHPGFPYPELPIRRRPCPVQPRPGSRISRSLFHRNYLLVTLGACALVFLAAFESMAVATIMPLVSRELDGAALYALAFAGPLATGVIGMVVATGPTGVVRWVPCSRRWPCSCSAC
jgi:hypothetical protein